MAYPVYDTSSGATGAGGNDWSWLIPLITGGANLATAHGDMTAAREAANMADPFASQRGQYQTQLNAYMADPNNTPGANGNQANINAALTRQSNFLDDPSAITHQAGYQFGLDQAMEAVNRGAGASGLLNSGNRLTALQDRGNAYAQGWQQQIWNELLGNTNSNISAGSEGLAAQGQQFNQLAALSGVNAGNPGNAAAALQQGRMNQAQTVGAGVGGVANGAVGAIQLFQRLFGGGGNYGVGSDGTINYGTTTGVGDQSGFPGSYEELFGDGGNTFTDTTGGISPDDWSWLTGG